MNFEQLAFSFILINLQSKQSLLNLKNISNRDKDYLVLKHKSRHLLKKHL